MTPFHTIIATPYFKLETSYSYSKQERLMNDIEFFVLSMIMHYKEKRGDSSLEDMIESIPRDFSFHLPKSLLYSMIQENLTTRDIISSTDSSEQKSIMQSPLKDISISKEMRDFYDRGYILGDREKESKTIYYDYFADDVFSMHKSERASSPNELNADFSQINQDKLKDFIANGLEKHFNLKIENIEKEQLSKDTKLHIRIDMSECVIEFASPSKKFANYLNGLNDTRVIQKLLDEVFISTQAGSEDFALLDLHQTHLATNATYRLEYQISDNLCIGRANAIEAIRQNHNQNHNTLFILLENDLGKSAQKADEQEEYNEIVIPNDFGLECGQWIDKDSLYTLYNVKLKMSKQRTKTLQIPVIEAKNDSSKITSVKEQVISYLQNEYKKYRDFSEIITSLKCYIALHALGAEPNPKPLSIALQTHDKSEHDKKQVELHDIQTAINKLQKSSIMRFITHYFEQNIPANKNLKMFLFGKCLEGREYIDRLHTIATHKSQHKGEEAKQLFEKYCQNPPLTKGTLSDTLLATLKDDSLEAIYEWIKPVFIKNMPKQNLADIKRASQYKLLDKSTQDIALSNRTLSQELFREFDKLATNQSIDSANEFASFTSHNAYKIIDLHGQLSKAIHPSDKLKLLQGLIQVHDKLQKECDINHTKEILENLREFSAGIFEHIDYFKKYNAKTIAIWDTSALIDFSKSLESKMRDLYNIVPKSVLKELDGLKNGDDERAQKVREVNRFLAKSSFDKYDDFDYDRFGTDDSLIEIAKDFLSDPLRKSLVKKVWIRSNDNNLCARANGTNGQLEKLYAGINDPQVNQLQKKRKKK
ncbi:PIN domain-containing protein [Helicobacter sp. MIT 01-3238]|uniref:PIN domain-containing protein n=1 Tax=Helicobacter sp. MIT 01-3238 TaxID=398627 RepID=UPI000E1EB06F|nr:PIN domain-containing protein [Helicobacter sp. MIT 01-3238]RDU54736.1 hypothetical protein CQA40_02640 [Helicobacter sp. MIT 01-3238]